MDLIDVASFSIILLSLAMIGWWSARKVSQEDSYLLADRKTGLFALTATLVMTEFNTSTLIAFSSLGYLAGWWALTLPAVFLVGLLFYGAVVAKKWKQFNGLSVAQFFTQRYGPVVGRMASLFLLAAMTGFSAVYVKSLTTLFSFILPSLSFVTLSFLLVAAVVFMTLRGGLVAIIYTDIFSFCLITVFLPALLIFSWINAGTPSIETYLDKHPLSSAISHLPPSFVLSILFLTMFTYILAPWYGQKIFAARSEKIARRSVFLAALLVFFFYGCAVITTSLLSDAASVTPEAALPYVLHHVMPYGWKGLGYGVFFAAAATTLSGVWSAMTSMVIGDFLGKQEKGGVQRSACITLVFAILSLILANTLVDKIFQKMILANIPVLALSFALLSGFYWDRASSRGALLSMIVGLVWGTATYCFFGEEGGYQWYWTMYGIPLIFLSGISGSLLFPQKLAHV